MSHLCLSKVPPPPTLVLIGRTWKPVARQSLQRHFRNPLVRHIRKGPYAEDIILVNEILIVYDLFKKLNYQKIITIRKENTHKLNAMWDFRLDPGIEKVH